MILVVLLIYSQTTQPVKQFCIPDNVENDHLAEMKLSKIKESKNYNFSKEKRLDLPPAAKILSEEELKVENQIINNSLIRGIEIKSLVDIPPHTISDILVISRSIKEIIDQPREISQESLSLVVDKMKSFKREIINLNETVEFEVLIGAVSEIFDVLFQIINIANLMPDNPLKYNVEKNSEGFFYDTDLEKPSNKYSSILSNPLAIDMTEKFFFSQEKQIIIVSKVCSDSFILLRSLKNLLLEKMPIWWEESMNPNSSNFVIGYARNRSKIKFPNSQSSFKFPGKIINAKTKYFGFEHTTNIFKYVIPGSDITSSVLDVTLRNYKSHQVPCTKTVIANKVAPEFKFHTSNFTTMEDLCSCHQFNVTNNQSSIIFLLKIHHLADKNFTLFLTHNITSKKFKIFKEILHFDKNSAFRLILQPSLFERARIWNLCLYAGNFKDKKFFPGSCWDVNHSISLYAVSCYRLVNEKLLNCQVGDKTSLDTTECICNSFSTFSASLRKIPTQLEFSLFHRNSDSRHNYLLYAAEAIALILYVVLAVWSYFKDLADAKNILPEPLIDNNVSDNCHYLINVKTGKSLNSGTKSQVRFILFGHQARTESRSLSGKIHKHQLRGADYYYVMSAPRSVGKICRLHIWIENFEETNSSWHLKQIDFTDLQTNENFLFDVGKWLGAEPEQRILRKVSPVSNSKKFSFIYRISQEIAHNFRDRHIWFSVFTAQAHSSFSRFERLACCASLVYLLMAANAIWLECVSESLKFPFIYKEIFDGIICSFIAFPVNFVIICSFKSPKTRNSPSSPAVNRNCCWRFISWVGVSVCIISGIATTSFYGRRFSHEKVNKWLASLVSSIIFSISMLQPFQVVAMSLFHVLVSSESSRENKTRSKAREEAKEMLRTKSSQQKTNEKGRKKSKKAFRDYETKQTIKHLLMHFLFWYVLTTVGYTNSSPHAYETKNNIQKMFLRHSGLSFDKIRTNEQFFHWSKFVLVPLLRADVWYNRDPPYFQKGYFSDRVSRVLGYAFFRQIRQKTGCSIHSNMSYFTEMCNPPHSIFNEDNADYGPGWKKMGKGGSFSHPEFLFQNMRETEALPIKGMIGIYGGGGYILGLRGSKYKLLEIIEGAQVNEWIDHRTKAVELQFTVYNPQTNIFAFSSLLFEWDVAGEISSYFYVSPIILFGYFDAENLYQLCFEGIFAILVLLAMVKEFKILFQEKTKYFKSWWNCVEIGITLLSLSVIILYIYRFFKVKDMLNKFSKSKGDAYLNFQKLAHNNDLLTWAIGFTLFLSTIKFIILLKKSSFIAVFIQLIFESMKMLLSFLIMFLIIFFAFVSFFYLAFNSHLFTYSTFLNSLESSLNMILGKFKFMDLVEANYRLAFPGFVLFGIFCTFILVSMLVSIINDSYAKAQKEESEEMRILDFIWTNIKCVFCRNKPKNEEPSENKTSAQKYSEFAERLYSAAQNNLKLELLSYIEKMQRNNNFNKTSSPT